MANDDRSDNSGWDFSTGSDASSSDGDEQVRGRRESEQSLIGDILSWFGSNQRFLIGSSTVVLGFFVLLVFASGQSKKPAYDIPGGEIELIEERKFTEWIQVTDRLSERRDSFENPINPGGTLFTYYTVLGSNSKLQGAVTEICQDELITLEEYRSVTHEIALTSPLENLKGFRNREQRINQLGEGSGTADTKQARIHQNLRLISEHYDRFERVWDELNQGNTRPGTE
jgi:hypothetical protein